MTGFLPLLTASNGTAPQAATDTAAPRTGALGAFDAVLAGLTGDAGAFAASVPDMMYAEGAPGPVLQRQNLGLKLAFADGGTLPGRSGLNASMASSMALLAATPTAAPGNTGEEPGILPGVGGAEGADSIVTVIEPAAGLPFADPTSADLEAGRTGKAQAALPEDEDVPEVAADAAVVVAAMASAQLLPAVEASRQPVTLTGNAGVDTMAAGSSAAEPLAGDAEAASPEQAPKGEMEPGSEQRDLPTGRHDLSAIGQTRALTGTVTTLPTQPSQAGTSPNAGSGETGNAAPEAAPTAGDAAQLAAIAPTAGQVASALSSMAGETAGELRRNGAALKAGVAGIAQMTGAPEQAAALTLDANPAATEKMQSAGNIPAAEPAARNAEADNRDRTLSDADRGQSAANQQPAAQSAAQSASQPAGQSANQTAALPEGLESVMAQTLHGQPLNGQSVHSHTGPISSLPHGADVVRVATPQQLPEAVSVAISRHVGAEATEFTLRLDPAELGRIEVKLEMGRDGQTSVSVQADNASTFDLLRRDSHALERALAEAGLKLDSGGLNFSLRQQDGQNQQQFAGDGAQRQASGRMQDASLAGSDPDNTPRPTRRSNASGLLDLSI